VEALALVKLESLRHVGVAPRAASFVAVLVLEGRSIVPCGHNTEFLHDDGPVAALHAVRPLRCQFCKLHEVGVPARPHKLLR